ncbi:MAG: amino acid ABC transporter permease [Alsobacter sp.]
MVSINITPLLVNWRFLLAALETTLLLTVLSVVLGAAIGLVVGTARAYGPRSLGVALGFYVDSMRAVPVLAILIWIFFAVPAAFAVSLPPLAAASLGLGLHIGAYFAETIRAGLLSVRRGQLRASLALGMSPMQAIRVVIMPQALIRMLPSFGSLLTITVKDTSIASVIAVPELMRQSQILAGQTYRPFEIYTFAMVVYFLICFPLARIVDAFYARVVHKGAS